MNTGVSKEHAVYVLRVEGLDLILTLPISMIMMWGCIGRFKARKVASQNHGRRRRTDLGQY